MVAEKQEEPVEDSCSFWQGMGVLKGSAGIYFLQMEVSLTINTYSYHVSFDSTTFSKQWNSLHRRIISSNILFMDVVWMRIVA